MNRVTRLLAIALAGVVVAGCTTTSAGEPRPEDTNTSSNRPDSPSSGTLPPRPREIRIDDVDPCDLIPPADQSDYHLEEPGRPKDDNGELQCFWSGTEDDHYGLILRTSEGSEAWIDGTQVYQGELSDPIQDFATVTFTLLDDETICFVSVDVADGQQLIAQASVDATPAGAQANCDAAHQFASSAMNTLAES